MAATLGYWDIRGLAHAIRLLLEYTGAPYEDKQYSPTGEGPDYDKSQWTNEKEKLGLDFPNLPYLIDGQTKLTQSNAILRYIARKHKMAGESEEEIQRVDMLENQVMDFRLAFARICYSPDFEKLKPEYLEQLPGKLKLFSQFLGDRKWFAGEKLTYVDFLMYDLLDQHRMFAPKCLDQLKNLKDFLDRFEALGEDRCLHEFWPLHEGSRFLESCPVEQQKGVGSSFAQPMSNNSVGIDPLQHLRRRQRSLGPL